MKDNLTEGLNEMGKACAQIGCGLIALPILIILLLILFGIL